MFRMFSGTTLFNQNVGAWNVSNVTNFGEFMVSKTFNDFSSTNLDAIYNGWIVNGVKPNISSPLATNISFGTAKYSQAGKPGRDTLLASPNNWRITDGGNENALTLDAGNPLSYPGTGTLWTDLSGNNNNGTLVNGPTFDSANGGSIVFDGLNDYVNFGTSNNINIRNATTLSLSAVVNCTGFSNPQTNYSWSPIMVIDNYSSGISYRKFDFYCYLENEIQKVQCDFFDGFGNSKSVFYNTTVLNTKIHIFVTVNSNNTVLYINGVSVNQNTGIIVNPNPQNSDFTIGSRINTNYNGYFKGNIYNAKIYNRAISASEVLQNYNSIKELYGI